MLILIKTCAKIEADSQKALYELDYMTKKIFSTDLVVSTEKRREGL